MQKVECGRQGLLVSRLGLGCMSMSHSYGPADEVEALKALQASLEEDVIFWDTADVYGNGHNERLLSPVLARRRSDIVLATKCGITGRNADGLTLNGRPGYIAQACEASLRRLGVEHIDLFYLHRVDPDVPVEESVGAMGELVHRGLVRAVGLSEASPESIRRAHKEFPLSALQSEYSLFTREVEVEILPLIRELGITLVAYSPLGRGLLSGESVDPNSLAADDFRRQLPRFEEENLKRNAGLVQRVCEVARSGGWTPAQVALAWLLSRGSDVVPIPGTKRPQYVVQNAQACRVDLSLAELEKLDFADQVAGARYPDSLARAVGR